MEVAWHFLAGYTSDEDINADIDFGAIDVSAYRALRIIGGFNATTNTDWAVDVDFATAGWTNLFSVDAGAVGYNCIVSLTLENTDALDTSLENAHWETQFGYVNTGGVNWIAAVYPSIQIDDYRGASNTGNQVIEGIRINPGSGDYEGSTGTETKFAMYGIKRTTA